MIVSSITQLIGRTPIVDVSDRFEDLYGRLFVKVESFNPRGSVKDRIGLGMVASISKPILWSLPVEILVLDWLWCVQLLD